MRGLRPVKNAVPDTSDSILKPNLSFIWSWNVAGDERVADFVPMINNPKTVHALRSLRGSSIALALSFAVLATPFTMLSAQGDRGGSKVVPRRDTLMGPGVSIELARLRARTVSDVHYALMLRVSSADSAPGSVTVTWKRAGNNDAFLDFRGRRLNKITVNKTNVPPSAFNGAHVRMPANLLLDGVNQATLEFVSEVAASGASIIKSHDPDGSDYLYTLLVPADANQLFPSFDQPDLKARVTFSLEAPKEWAVVANGAEHQMDVTGANAIHSFNETKPLSTYLIAFAAGPWAKATSVVNGRSVSVYVRKSRVKEADLDTMLALNQRAQKVGRLGRGIGFQGRGHGQGQGGQAASGRPRIGRRSPILGGWRARSRCNFRPWARLSGHRRLRVA